MSLIFDEYGRPFILVKDQDKKSRKKGVVSTSHLPAIDPPCVSLARDTQLLQSLFKLFLALPRS